MAFGEAHRGRGLQRRHRVGMGGSSLAPGGPAAWSTRSRTRASRSTCSTRPHPEAVAGAGRRHSTRSAPCASWPPSRARRPRRSPSWPTTGRRRSTAWGASPAHKAGDGFVSISDPGRRPGGHPALEQFREIVPQPRRRGRPLQRPHLRRASCRRPCCGLDLDALLEDARIMADLTARRRRRQPGPRAGRRHGRPGAGRARQADLRHRARPGVRWAPGWSSSSPSPPARTASASCPSTASRWVRPEVYGADRVFVRLGPGSDDEWHRDVDAKLAALVAAGHPLIDIRLDDAVVGRPASSSAGSSPPPWRASVSASTPSTSPTSPSPSTTRPRSWRASPTRAACRTWSRPPPAARCGPTRSSAATASHATGATWWRRCAAHLARVARGRLPPGRRLRRSHRERDGAPARASRPGCATPRARPPRWATARASCTPPASSTRAARPSAASSSSPAGRRGGPAHPRAARRPSACSSSPGAGRLRRPSAPTTCRRIRIHLGDDPDAGLAELDAAFADALA